MAMQAIERATGPCRWSGSTDLPGDGLVMPCGLIGAPTVATERIWSGEEALVLRARLEELAGASVVALMCYEIAGANGLLPVSWAGSSACPCSTPTAWGGRSRRCNSRRCTWRACRRARSC